MGVRGEGWREAGADAGLGLDALALYVGTVAPGLYILDSAELAAGAHVLGSVQVVRAAPRGDPLGSMSLGPSHVQRFGSVRR